MSSPVIAVESHAYLPDAIKILMENDIESLVVLHQGRVAGILTFRDLVMKVLLTGRSPSETTVGEVMSGPPVTCLPNTKLIELMKQMKKRRLRRFPVVDGDGRPVGFISSFDIGLVGLSFP